MGPKTYDIGSKICILTNNPPEIELLCGGNKTDMIRPKPRAEWTLPAGLNTDLISYFDTPLRWGDNDQLTIDNDGDPKVANPILGTYTCNLSNSEGWVRASTEIRKLCIT